MAFKRQHARFISPLTTSQTVHSRRHVSLLSPDNVIGEKPQSNVDESKAGVTSGDSQETSQPKSLDGIKERYKLCAAEDASNSTSKYQVLFNDDGVFFFGNNGKRPRSRRNVL